MEPVYRLIVDDGLRSIHEFVGRLDAARGGQAMHETGCSGRIREEVGVDLEFRHEGGAALGNLVFLTEPLPETRVDDVGSGAGGGPGGGGEVRGGPGSVPRA